MNIFDSISLGFDQAKKTIYDIMKQYYPKISTSRSTLVNAFVSGIAYIYAMYQVFVMLIRDELYVATAKEIDSLFKLIPFVGIRLPQPVPMQLTTLGKPQDETISLNTDPLMTVIPYQPFTDSTGNKFHSVVKTYTKRRVLLVAEHLVTASGKKLTVSLGKALGGSFFPASLYDTDNVVIEFLYKKSATIYRGAVRFVRGATIPVVSDAGSDAPADLDLVNTLMLQTNGVFVLALAGTATFDDSAVYGTSVSVSFTVRSCYYKRMAAMLTAANAIGVSSAYTAANVVANPGNLIFNPSVAQHDFWVVGPAAVSVDPYSVKIKQITGAYGYGFNSITIDFTNAEVINDSVWGQVYRAIAYLPGSTSDPLYAYILDEFAGFVVYDRLLDTMSAAVPVEISGSTKPNNVLLLQQYDEQVNNIIPAKDFNFTTMSYILETSDILLYDDIAVKITDAGYTSVVFSQVDSISAVEGSNYFEVSVLGQRKAEIKFKSSINWAAISNVQIIYKTIKSISDYKSGEQLIGPVKMYKSDKTLFTKSGVSVFNFQATNTAGSDGATGVPTLESLRSLLSNAAYTLNSNITRVNYEAAIAAYFVSQGYDARVKVFGYEDIGASMVDSFNGNVVFFLGLVNRSPNNKGLIVTVPKELDPTAQYTREQLALSIPGSLTDVGQKLITLIGKDADEVDNIQSSIREDSTLTNVILTKGDGADAFGQMYPVYFKIKVRPTGGYTYLEAADAVKRQITSLFTWEVLRFIRDIKLSDVYASLDALPAIDSVFIENMSNYHNDSVSIVAHDISYIVGVSSNDNPSWDFTDVEIDRLIKVDILGLGGIETEEY